MTSGRSLLLTVAAFAACTPRFAQTAEDPGIGGSDSLGGTSGSGGSTLGGAGAGAVAGGGASGGTEASGGAGAAGLGGGTVLPCPADLKDRISLKQFTVSEDIRYKRPTYDYAPQDNRLALSLTSNGGYVAWVNNDLTKVHVTPLDAEMVPSGPDVVVDGSDVGGLVAHEDGFALLVRRTDPGEQLTESNAGTIATAVVLLRYKNGAEVFAAPLTGTKQINPTLTPEQKRDCAPRPFEGRLAYNGSRYGAYFTVAGCDGHPGDKYYGDKLIYVDDNGAFAGGDWLWHCSKNRGVRLLPESSAFMALCMSDLSPTVGRMTPIPATQPGLNLVVEGGRPLRLAEEYGENGYSAGVFGSVVKSAGAYFVGWLSRGPMPGSAPADPAFLRLDLGDRSITSPLKRILETPLIAETNLHFAPYGADRLLMVWDDIDNPNCSPRTCFGPFGGTQIQLLDAAGNPVPRSDAAGNPLPAQFQYEAAPNTDDDIVVFKTGDLGWAFVPEPTRDYSRAYPPDLYAPPPVPQQQRIQVARLRYCQ